MSGPVFLAVLLAALLHASWNALVKGDSDKHVAMTAVVLGHVPAALLVRLDLAKVVSTLVTISRAVPPRLARG